jgi:hypothetical protein
MAKLRKLVDARKSGLHDDSHKDKTIKVETRRQGDRIIM